MARKFHFSVLRGVWTRKCALPLVNNYFYPLVRPGRVLCCQTLELKLHIARHVTNRVLPFYTCSPVNRLLRPLPVRPNTLHLYIPWWWILHYVCCGRHSIRNASQNSKLQRKYPKWQLERLEINSVEDKLLRLLGFGMFRYCQVILCCSIPNSHHRMQDPSA
jgi:hypothetical protein